jgi:hypothetical protein
MSRICPGCAEAFRTIGMSPEQWSERRRSAGESARDAPPCWLIDVIHRTAVPEDQRWSV